MAKLIESPGKVVFCFSVSFFFCFFSARTHSEGPPVQAWDVVLGDQSWRGTFNDHLLGLPIQRGRLGLKCQVDRQNAHTITQGHPCALRTTHVCEELRAGGEYWIGLRCSTGRLRL